MKYELINAIDQARYAWTAVSEENLTASRKHTAAAIGWLEEYLIWLDHKELAAKHKRSQ